MLICFKSHKGGLNLNVGGINIRLSGYGLIDNVDENLYQRARQLYPFLEGWEKDGTIEVGQNKKQDEASFETEKKEQSEQVTKNEKVTKQRVKKRD